MYKRNHHVRIATVLEALDGEILKSHGCLFGGGTAIVLANGEYRESVDIDFLVSDLSGYRDLRNLIKESKDLSPIVRKQLKLNLPRKIRSDQYGIRTHIDQGGVEIKFEIVYEGRIKLETPGLEDRICGIASLTRLDMATSKLLANSDRWADDSVFSRDLIDLAMLGLSPAEYAQAIRKAQAAYGEAVVKDINKAIDHIKSRPGRLDTCMDSLSFTKLPEAALWGKIRKLRLRSEICG